MSDPTKPKRGRPQTLDADRVLDVAMQAYWAKDPADVSLNEICRLAEVSKPPLYRQFGNEDGLMEAVVQRYAEQVLSDVFVVLRQELPLDETMAALIHFASADPQMETGCVFFKMRAGKHRLGPKTRQAVEAIEAAAVDGFEAYLKGRRERGDWQGDLCPDVAARYLVEQIGLALMQRAAGEDTARIRTSLSLSLSAIRGAR